MIKEVFLMATKIRVSLNSLTSPFHPVFINQLAVTTLSGYLQRALGDQVELFVHCSQFETPQRMAASLKEEDPDIIGVSLQFGSQSLIAEFMKRIRQAAASRSCPPVVVFGNVLSTFAYKILLGEYPDVIMAIGEGEDALEGIIRKVMQKSADFDTVPNIAFIKEGKIFETPRQAFDLERSGLPSFDYLRETKDGEGQIWIEASRGCNSRCAFCSRYPVRMTRWTPISIDKVMDTIKAFNSQFGINHFRFSDDDFMGTDSSLGSPHAEEFARAVIKSGLNITFDISARVEAVYSSNVSDEENRQKEELFKLLRRVGLTQVFLGVESGSCEQLKRFGKKPSVDENLVASKKLDELGIQVVMGFITVDFLMDIGELEENISFLERVGAFDEKKQIFVSDPLVVMRAQEGSQYIRILDKLGLLVGRNTTNHLIYDALYKDRRIEAIAETLKLWRENGFSLLYALKSRVSKLSMEKDCSAERKILEHMLGRFKLLDYEYLIAAVKCVKEGQNPGTLNEEFAEKRLSLVVELEEELSSGVDTRDPFLRREIEDFMNDINRLILKERMRR